MTLNSIGLETKKTQEIANDLNILLANFQIYYQNMEFIYNNFIKSLRVKERIHL